MMMFGRDGGRRFASSKKCEAKKNIQCGLGKSMASTSSSNFAEMSCGVAGTGRSHAGFGRSDEAPAGVLRPMAPQAGKAGNVLSVLRCSSR